MSSLDRRPRLLDQVGLIVLAALLFLPFLGARDLWNPNEPIYGQAVVEMDARADWVLPSVNGEPFVEKPILYYWAALAVSTLAGDRIDEWTLRIPSAAAGALAVWLLYLLVTPYAGRRRALWAAALLATTFLVFWSARRVQMDLLVLLFTLATILAVTRVWDHGRPAGRGWAAAGLFAGLGFLAKGPVGVVLPGIALSLYRLGGVRARRWHVGAMVGGFGVMLLVTAPWYLLLARQGGWPLVEEVLFRQNVVRYLEPWDHVEPWWYFGKYLWLDMVPWVLLLPLAIGLRGRDDGERRLNRLAWLWLIGIVVFFSFSGSKRSPYILPVAPAVALLVAGVVERWVDRKLPAWRARAVWLLAMIWSLALVGGAVGVAVGGLPERVGRVLPTGPLIGLLAVVGLVVLVALLVRRRLPVALPLALLLSVAAIYEFAAWRLPAVNPYKSAREFCRVIVAEVGERPLRSYRPWKWRASYIYYSGRSIPKLETAQALVDYWERDEQVFVLVEKRMLEEARGLLGVEPIAGDTIGGNAAYLFTNRPAAFATDPAVRGRRSTAEAR